jgi:cation transport ATPase
MLRLAASLENASEHPLAAGIVHAAKDRSISLFRTSEFDSPAGKGVVGRVDGPALALGNAKFVARDWNRRVGASGRCRRLATRRCDRSLHCDEDSRQTRDVLLVPAAGQEKALDRQ